MSNKVELQRILKEIGYEIGPFASKETLQNVLRLHTLALETKDVNVSKLNDLELRKNLNEYSLTVGPVTNHTRSIYQRKLLEVLTNEQSEGQEDEFEVDETTPPRTTRSSIARGDTNVNSSSPGRFHSNELQEPRISLTRIDVADKHIRNPPTFYPNVSQTKSIHSSTAQETITHACSPQRSTAKAEIRSNIITSHALRDPYDFQNDEPIVTRHEHKATPFRATNISSIETLSTNTNRYTKSSDLSSSTRWTKPIDDLNEIRSRILTNTGERKEIPDLKTSSEKKTSTSNETIQVSAKSSGTFLYAAIAIGVGLLVFVLYIWHEN